MNGKILTSNKPNITTIEKLRTKKSLAFFQNIEYFTNNKDGSLLFINNTKYTLSNRSIYVIQYICKLHLTSLTSYLIGIKYHLNYKYNIPVVLSKEIKLISSLGFKNYNNIWINLSKVSYIDNNNVIYFKSGNKIKFNNTLKYYYNACLKIENILLLNNSSLIL